MKNNDEEIKTGIESENNETDFYKELIIEQQEQM